MPVTFPESVLAYFKDHQVRAGVDAMMTRADKLPADLKWTEMAAYYRALSAAQRLVADHAMLLDEFWQEVWAPAIPSAWVGLDPDDQVADTGRSPHPKACWDQGGHFRCYTRGLRVIHTGVALSESGVSVGFGVFKERTGNSALRGPIDGFEFDEDDECFWQEKLLSIPRDGVVEVDDLVAYRDRALSIIRDVK